MTKAEMKFLQLLRLKKYRDERGLFIAEGGKLVHTLRQHLTAHSIYATSPADIPAAIISEAEMKKISLFATPPKILGVFEKPCRNPNLNLASQWTLALDDVQDPANVGAIIRLCDWFGIPLLLCSAHTADCYAPKVVQATMGAIARVSVMYVDLADFLSNVKVCIYGTFLTGNNIYKDNLTPNGIIVLGSEGQGISSKIAALVNKTLHIPSFSKNMVSESLNVSTAAAIVCSEIRRRTGV
jgi:TrmH family RNA methyltransferase